MGNREAGRELGAPRALHAVVGPQYLRAIGEFDHLERPSAGMRRRERPMLRRMPVLGEHDVLEARGDAIDDRDDGVASRHGKRASGQEVVLDVHDDEHRAHRTIACTTGHRTPIIVSLRSIRNDRHLMHEILPGIFTWSRRSEPHGYDFNGHLIVHPQGNLCIDPVEPDAETLGRLAGLGVASIVLTNRNHSRAANVVRARTGGRTLIHPADAERARGQGAVIDGDIEVGASIGPFTVTDAAGKSPGEIALHWPAREILVVGDAVIGNPPGACSLLRDSVVDDPPRLRRAVTRLATLDFDTLLVGDGTSIPTGAAAALKALVATFATP